MNSHDIKYLAKKRFKRVRARISGLVHYMLDFIIHAYFRLLIFFVLNFVIIGLYVDNFFQTNFAMFIILIVADLYSFKKLLGRRIYFSKVLTVAIVLYVAFYLAQAHAAVVFQKIGLSNLLSLGESTEQLTDGILLAGTKNMIKKAATKSQNVLDEINEAVDTNSIEDSKEAFKYINSLRADNGKSKILWDDRIYQLALFKAEDMTDNDYFDHPDQQGKCLGSHAPDFNLTYPANSFADNIFGYDRVTTVSMTEAVDSWMDSRGHRYNLLYSAHKRGAIACDSKNCVFIGQGGSNWVCDTGSAGLSYWRTASKQQGE